MPCGLPLERKSYATEAGPVAVCVLSFLSVVRTTSLSRCDVACLGVVAAPSHLRSMIFTLWYEAGFDVV